nr:hypothetical protein [Amylibacter sp.]
MRLSLAVAASVATLLSACGSGGSDGAVTTPGSPTGGTDDVSGRSPAKVLLVGDNQATRLENDADNRQIIVETIPFDDEVFESRLDRNRALDQNGYQAYSSVRGFDNYTAFRGESSTGDVAVIVVNSGDYIDHGYSGATYERGTTTFLPNETQRAYYQGKYIGTRTSDVGGGMDIINADAKMEADFSDDTFRGWITNRTLTQNDTGVDVGSDITLKNSIIDRDNSTFQGEVVQNVEGTDGGGIYSGVFGGDEGQETAGYILTTVGDNRELGVFTAER